MSLDERELRALVEEEVRRAVGAPVPATEGPASQDTPPGFAQWAHTSSLSEARSAPGRAGGGARGEALTEAARGGGARAPGTGAPCAESPSGAAPSPSPLAGASGGAPATAAAAASRAPREARASNLARPANPALLERLMTASPSRLGVGRTGTRYPTRVYLELRADHAIAKDAVESEIGAEFAAKLGCLALQSRCRDKQEFLLHPARGRRLDEPSVARLQQEATRGVDVQLVVGDGLSAWAAEVNAPELLPLLQRELAGAGFSLGRPLFVRFARVGVQDHIGTLLGAKATAILLGERPGLGTGDSLSIYLAYGPKLDQDNAEKNCISNVRPLGIRPPEAARLAAQILRRAFDQGRGGLGR